MWLWYASAIPELLNFVTVTQLDREKVLLLHFSHLFYIKGRKVKLPLLKP